MKKHYEVHDTILEEGKEPKTVPLDMFKKLDEAWLYYITHTRKDPHYFMSLVIIECRDDKEFGVVVDPPAWVQKVFGGIN